MTKLTKEQFNQVWIGTSKEGVLNQFYYEHYDLIRYISIVEMVKDELTKGITFCENDSQGHYDICNIAINREKKILEKIKELEEGNNND